MKKKYWYKFFYEDCPMCGRCTDWKERVYNKPKPKDPRKRYNYKEVWDYCQY